MFLLVHHAIILKMLTVEKQKMYLHWPHHGTHNAMALLEDILKKFRVEYDIDIVHHGIERNLKIMYLFWQPRLNKFAKIISESCKTGPLKWLKMSSKIKRFWLVQLTCPCRPSSYHTMPWINNMKQQNTLMKKTFLIYSRGSQGCLKGSNQFQGHRRAQGKKKTRRAARNLPDRQVSVLRKLLDYFCCINAFHHGWKETILCEYSV